MFNVDAEFARFLDISPSRLANWKARGTYNTQILFTKCEDVNPMFILKGQEPVSADEAMMVMGEYRELTEEEGKAFGENHRLWREHMDECFRLAHLGVLFPDKLTEVLKSVEGKDFQLQNELESFKDKVILQQEERIKELKEYIEVLKANVKAL